MLLVLDLVGFDPCRDGVFMVHHLYRKTRVILTGRAVAADEALAMGLANRVVDDGQALAEALALARQIAAFPQRCMRADRASALAQWPLPLAQALQHEGAGGHAALQAEGVAGAARFASGQGRHGAPATPVPATPDATPD